MKPVSKKVLLYTVPAVLIAAFIVALRPGPLPVDLAAAVRGPLRVTLDEEGETRVRERFVVSSPVAGRILRIELEPGDPVTPGQVLAVVRPGAPQPLDARTRANLQAQVQAAEAALGRARAGRERAQAELGLAQAEHQRFAALESQGILSRDRLEVAKVNVETREALLAAAEAETRMAQHQLEAARASLLESAGEGTGASVEVRAPSAGRVLRRLRESETVVAAGEPLLEVGDAKNLEVIADFLSTDAAQLRPGMAAELEPTPGKVLLGTIRTIEPSGFTKISALGVEEQRVNVVLRLDNPPEDWLADGFRVEVRAVVWEAKDVLKVPTSALFRDAQGWTAYVEKDGKATTRRLEVGWQNGLEAEIRGGLAAGEKVILHPSADVKDGAAVAGRE
jgi:HlyD family secretion protein